jgi:hypothetical protein
LEHALRPFILGDAELTAVQIESVLTADLHTDQEIVDFALVSGERVLTVAQVKSGYSGSSLSASDLVAMLLRLLSHSAERYVVITNRSSTPSLRDLLALLESGKPDVRDEMLSLVRRSKIFADLHAAGHEFWERLRRAEVTFDRRGIEQVRGSARAGTIRGGSRSIWR